MHTSGQNNFSVAVTQGRDAYNCQWRVTALCVGDGGTSAATEPPPCPFYHKERYLLSSMISDDLLVILVKKCVKENKERF